MLDSLTSTYFVPEYSHIRIKCNCASVPLLDLIKWKLAETELSCAWGRLRIKENTMEIEKIGGESMSFIRWGKAE